MTTLSYKSTKTTPARWQDLWQRIANALSTTQDLQVWQDFDRTGKLLWHAYDPMTNRSFSGAEPELRSWIEGRYDC